MNLFVFFLVVPAFAEDIKNLPYEPRGIYQFETGARDKEKPWRFEANIRVFSAKDEGKEKSLFPYVSTGVEDKKTVLAPMDLGVHGLFCGRMKITRPEVFFEFGVMGFREFTKNPAEEKENRCIILDSKALSCKSFPCKLEAFSFDLSQIDAKKLPTGWSHRVLSVVKKIEFEDGALSSVKR